MIDVLVAGGGPAGLATALYGAKAEGRGSYRYYEPEMNARMKRRSLSINFSWLRAARRLERWSASNSTLIIAPNLSQFSIAQFTANSISREVSIDLPNVTIEDKGAASTRARIGKGGPSISVNSVSGGLRPDLGPL